MSDKVAEASPSSTIDRCPICLHPAHVPAHVKGCNHIFCLDCVRTWASSRNNPKCPLCQAEIAFLCHSGVEEPVVPPPSNGQPDETPPDLGCLDHSYFANEANRLLRRARSAQHNLAASAYGCGRRGSAQTDLASRAIHEVIASLDERKSIIDEEIPFDPGSVLHEFYSLEQVLCSIQDGSFVGVGGEDRRSSSYDASRSRRYSAADLQYLSSHDEQYLYDDSDEEDQDLDDEEEEEIARHAERLTKISLGGSTAIRGTTIGRKGGAAAGGAHRRQKSGGR